MSTWINITTGYCGGDWFVDISSIKKSFWKTQVEATICFISTEGEVLLGTVEINKLKNTYRMNNNAIYSSFDSSHTYYIKDKHCWFEWFDWRPIPSGSAMGCVVTEILKRRRKC